MKYILLTIFIASASLLSAQDMTRFKLYHTQNSEYLEEGKSYSRAKVTAFFKGWTILALDPKEYKDQ